MLGSDNGTRVLTIITVVLVASLGSVFLVGRLLGATNQPDTAPAQVAATAPTEMATSGPSPAEGAPPTGDAPATTEDPATTDEPFPTDGPDPVPPLTAAPVDPSDEPDTQPDRPGLAPGLDGPYGSRQTTGTAHVALTFDDGPDPRYTPQALALLRRYQVKATFCVVGELVREHPELVREIADDGHTLCNHSWSHDFRLGSRPKTAILADLARTSEAIRAAVPDAPIPYFRQPGGNWTPQVVAVASQLGMTSLHWAVDPRDWEQPPPARIAAQVVGETQPGAIVLLHDGGGHRQNTIDALAPILANLIGRFHLSALPTELHQR